LTPFPPASFPPASGLLRLLFADATTSRRSRPRR